MATVYGTAQKVHAANIQHPTREIKLYPANST